MTPQVHDLAMRVAQAVQAAAAHAAGGNAHETARRGHDVAARTQEHAAHAVKRLDIASIVAQVAEIAPIAAEQEAFTAAARSNLFDCNRRPTGEYVNPFTSRAHAVWQAAVRWTNLTDRSPAPQDKAETGVAAD